MRKIITVLALLSAVGWAQAQNGGAAATKPDDEPLAVVNKLFEAMRAKDAAGIRALFTAEGRLVAFSRREGQPPSVRVFDGDSFAKLIADAKGTLDERMPKPDMRVAGDLAEVSGRYTFHVDGRFSHCGTNAFHLTRAAAGWRIVNIASTLEMTGCEAGGKAKD
ncbi:MAG: nuclear transport factor 2 family protein [Pyrinomonadaceae bacterium]